MGRKKKAKSDAQKRNAAKRAHEKAHRRVSKTIAAQIKGASVGLSKIRDKDAELTFEELCKFLSEPDEPKIPRMQLEQLNHPFHGPYASEFHSFEGTGQPEFHRVVTDRPDIDRARRDGYYDDAHGPGHGLFFMTKRTVPTEGARDQSESQKRLAVAEKDVIQSKDAVDDKPVVG